MYCFYVYREKPRGVGGGEDVINLSSDLKDDAPITGSTYNPLAANLNPFQNGTIPQDDNSSDEGDKFDETMVVNPLQMAEQGERRRSNSKLSWRRDTVSPVNSSQGIELTSPRFDTPPPGASFRLHESSSNILGTDGALTPPVGSISLFDTPLADDEGQPKSPVKSMLKSLWRRVSVFEGTPKIDEEAEELKLNFGGTDISVGVDVSLSDLIAEDVCNSLEEMK